MLTREVSVVFQNIDGDGLPTLLGDYVGIVEAPSDKRRLRRKLRWAGQNTGTYFPEKNYRMAAGWNDDVLPLYRSKVKTVKVHGSSTKPPTPRRDLLITIHKIEDIEVAFIVGHAINSAWAPKSQPTSFRDERRDLWAQWADVLTTEVQKQLAKERRVVVLIDGNRSRPENWTIPGLKIAFHEPHGPDRILVSKGVIVGDHEIGPRTGNGRVTHHSIKIALRFERN